MQVPAVASEFLTLLEKSGLFSAAMVRKAREKFDFSKEVKPEEIARRLVRERLLTPFQAERLLEGRYRGFLIDRYRVREVLGVGGMGCVYIAEDPLNNRKVALKVLSSQHALDAGMLARMKLEAHAGMMIKHPNVVETFDIGSTGAVNFMVMELVRGISLHELVVLGGAVTWPMACDMIRQAAMGLHAAHQKGIIHRDLKPANVLISSDGSTRVLDFGLAKLERDEADEFSLAMIFGHDCLGTPDYIAPEQSTDSNAVDARADVYGLGCTFYVALTGRVPFTDKQNSKKIEAHRLKTAPTVRELVPEIPAEVSAIVERMMAKSPDDRFESAQAVADALAPLASRRAVKFDFRHLVTLRAKQARSRETVQRRRTTGPRSSITSASEWMNNPSHHFAAEIDTVAAKDTPAVRQPAPPLSRTVAEQNRTEAASRSQDRSANVPAGWAVQILNSHRKISLVRVKNRVGTSAECEIPLPGTCSDERQCTIDFDGRTWRLNQESRSQPTFVNGSPQTFAEIEHGDKVTLSDGNGFQVISAVALARDRKRQRQLLIALGVLGGIVSAAAAVWFFLR